MNKNKFIKITLYNGLKGYVNINHISGFYEKKDEDVNVKTAIILTTTGKSNEWWVRETFSQILKLIN